MKRLSLTMRNEIGPQVDDEYTRTQAFMVSVILERLSREVALAPAHSQAEQDDVQGLSASLGDVLNGAPAEVLSALAALRQDLSVAAVGRLVESLYDWGIEQPSAASALSMIRPVLRRDIDRRMEIAR